MKRDMDRRAVMSRHAQSVGRLLSMYNITILGESDMSDGLRTIRYNAPSMRYDELRVVLENLRTEHVDETNFARGFDLWVDLR